MSAFMCDDEHFRQLAGWLASGDRNHIEWLARRAGYVPPEDSGGYIEATELATHIARVLKRENVRSLGERYCEETAEEMTGNVFESKFLKPITLGELQRMARIDAGRITKATKCYEYQACESADWEQTKAHEICNLIYREVGTRLPGYEGAPWGTPEEFTEPAPVMFSLSDLAHKMEQGQRRRR